MVNTTFVLVIQCRDPEKHQVSALRYQEIFNASERGQMFT